MVDILPGDAGDAGDQATVRRVAGPTGAERIDPRLQLRRRLGQLLAVTLAVADGQRIEQDATQHRGQPWPARRWLADQELPLLKDGGRLATPFDRITVEPDKLEGKPCIRGLRITVETVVRLVAAGWTFDDILQAYPDLEQADIRQALEYAAAATDVHFHRLQAPA